MELVAEQVVKLHAQFVGKFFAFMAPAILQAHHQVYQVGIGQQDRVVADEFAYLFQALHRLVLAHKLRDFGAKHGIVMRQTDIETLLILRERLVLIAYQFVGRVHSDDMPLILEGWKVGGQALTIPRHSGVENNIDVGVTKSLQGLDLVCMELHTANPQIMV